MSGTIYLGGGGTYTDEAALWRLMLSDHPRVVYWPFTLPRRQAKRAEQWLTGALADLGVGADLDIWTRLKGHSPDELESADLLFVGGGNTFTLLDTVQRCGFVAPVRAWVEQGGHYYGGSAGAILAGDDIAIAARLDPNDPKIRDLTGFDLIGTATVLPHFEEAGLHSAQDWSAEHGRPVLGLPERSGVVIVDGTASVTGPDPVWLIDGTRSVRHEPGADFPLADLDRPD